MATSNMSQSLNYVKLFLLNMTEFTVVRSQSNSAHLGVEEGESHVMVIQPKSLSFHHLVESGPHRIEVFLKAKWV